MTENTIYRQLKRADAKRIQCMRCGQRARVCRIAYWLAGSRKGVSFFYLCDECVCSDFEVKTRRIVLRKKAA